MIETLKGVRHWDWARASHIVPLSGLKAVPVETTIPFVVARPPFCRCCAVVEFQ